MEINKFMPVGPPFVSPRPGDSHGLEAPVDPSDLGEVVEALTARVFVLQGVWPDWFFEARGLPLFDGLSCWLRDEIELSAEANEVSKTVAAADLVRMDHPFDAADLIENYYMEQGFGLSTKYEGIDFVERVQSKARCHEAVAAALDKAFDVKYAFEQPRPIARVKAVTGYGDIGEEIVQQYPHPAHWSDPAGHGAFFGATAGFMASKWDAPAEVETLTTLSCRVAAHFRTFSFMHTASENDRGFDIGYDIGYSF